MIGIGIGKGVNGSYNCVESTIQVFNILDLMQALLISEPYQRVGRRIGGQTKSPFVGLQIYTELFGIVKKFQSKFHLI